jgi:hypothetical protein
MYVVELQRYVVLLLALIPEGRMIVKRQAIIEKRDVAFKGGDASAWQKTIPVPS